MDVHEFNVVALQHPTQLEETPWVEGGEGDLDHGHPQGFELAEIGTIIGTSDTERKFSLHLADQIVDVLCPATNPL
jgi:hypothetical protein